MNLLSGRYFQNLATTIAVGRGSFEFSVSNTSLTSRQFSASWQVFSFSTVQVSGYSYSLKQRIVHTDLHKFSLRTIERTVLSAPPPFLSTPVHPLSAPPSRFSTPVQVSLNTLPRGFKHTSYKSTADLDLSNQEFKSSNQKHSFSNERDRGIGENFLRINKTEKQDDSPAPTFETDEQTYALVTLPEKSLVSNTAGNEAKIHLFNTLEYLITFGNGARDGASIIHDEVHDRVKEMLALLLERKKRSEPFELMGFSNQTKNRERYLDQLIHYAWVQKEHEEGTHPGKRYYTSESSKRILELM
ncbi:MAG: hypothetical protein KGZ90_08825 [Algoriphagus sp.]|nr:hypothetical protein [Algoriphagus sp.]